MKNKQLPPGQFSAPYEKLTLEEAGLKGDEPPVQSRDTPLKIGTGGAYDIPRPKRTTQKEKREQNDDVELAPLSPAALDAVEFSLITRRGIHINITSLLALAFTILATALGGMLITLWLILKYGPKLFPQQSTEPNAIAVAAPIEQTQKTIQGLQTKIDALARTEQANKATIQSLREQQQSLTERLEKHLRRRRDRNKEDVAEQTEKQSGE